MMGVFVEYANFCGRYWASWVLTALLDSGVLLTLVGVIWLSIRRRVAPHVGYWLFLLVPLKLLSPVMVTMPVAIAQWTPAHVMSQWLEAVPLFQESAGQPAFEAQVALSATDRSIRTDTNSESLARSNNVAGDGHSSAPPPETKALPEIASPTGREIPAVSRVTRLSVSALAMIVWTMSVLLLVARFIYIQLRFRAWLQKASPIDESRLGVDLGEMRRRARVTQSVRLVESDAIAAPAVWGIARPTIILPRAVTSSLTVQQLQWVLLHELAHIRRRDLLVIVLQRCVAILHFFNPFLWLANRIIHRLREYACDDLAAGQSDGSAVDFGQAFLHILQHAQSNHRRLEGALGVFGLDSRASSFLRIRRLLDTDRPIRTSFSNWSLCGLLLLALAALPHVSAATDEAPAAADKAAPSNQPAPEAAAKSPANEQDFELQVVGPDGKPIPEAIVEVRTDPLVVSEQIRQGKFLRKGPYGTFLITDADGRMVIERPQASTSFDVNITTPGYGPYWARWSSETHDEPIPPSFTAELDAGWSIGGVVVDASGATVEGVKVHPYIDFKKRLGDLETLALGTKLTTDATGTWQFDSVPDSKNEILVEISHPDFKPDRRSLTRSEFGIERGQEPVAKIVLDRGLSIDGRVTDDAGNPIAGALVRTKFLNNVRKATTGEDGVYRLIGCESVSAKVVVSARGRATDMKEVVVEPDMDPVDFQMRPGGKVHIRVLDEHGSPIPKARIFFQRWRGNYAYFEFGHVDQYADEQGVWKWDEAPLDQFEADICRPDGMQLGRQPLISRDEAYVFRPPPALVVSGRVIDAETKEPVKVFQVLPGVRSSPTDMNWVEGERFTATDGKFQIRHTHDSFAHLIRIEASGYQAIQSRDIKSNEGSISIDFELKKGQDVAATVMTPEGKPAAGAKVALGVVGAQINIQNGEMDGRSTYAAQRETDESGQFRLPPQDGAFQLIVLHPSGYAHITASSESKPKIIQLQAWAKVEGTFRIGKNLMPNIPITINTTGMYSGGNDAPHIFTHYDTTTGKDGRFTFLRVVPGDSRIGRRIMLTVNDGAVDITSSCMMPVKFSSGETTRIDLGGTGQSVVGRLQVAAGLEKNVNWHFALIDVESYFSESPPPGDLPIPEAIKGDRAKVSAWLLEWQQTGPGRLWEARKTAFDAKQQLRDASPRFTASINRDGTFRIDDLPTGDYAVRVQFFRGGSAGSLRDYHFSVPSTKPDRSDQPLDLGVLMLE